MVHSYVSVIVRLLVKFREAQNSLKTIFFCRFLVLSGKLGKQSLRFRAEITFFVNIAVFLYENENSVDHMIHGRQFCTSLNSVCMSLLLFEGESGSRTLWCGCVDVGVVS